MTRIFVGGVITLLLITGAFLFWQGHASKRTGLPAAPVLDSSAEAAPASPRFAMLNPSLRAVPEATLKTREEKRFSRADKDKDGKITAEELLMPRHKAFAKLDADRNNQLSFNEWASKTITKFQGADGNRDGELTATEYAETAPKPNKNTQRCAC